MSKRTTIKFFGCLPPEYAGGPRKGCSPTDPNADGWRVTVGATQANIRDADDFARLFGSFLERAYQAGIEDAKVEMKERLGL